MNKNIFKITFYDEDHKSVVIHAEKVYQSDILGFIEVDKLVFLDHSEIIVTPDDDKMRNMFKNTVKTLIPINLIIRIDEIAPTVNASVINIFEREK